MKNIQLNYKIVWLSLGWLLVLFVVHQTLVPKPIDMDDIEISDKLMHVTGYFILMGWFVQIYHGVRQRWLLAAAFVSMGVTLEFLQGLGGVRQYEVADMLANASGVVLAGLLSLTPFSRILMWVDARLKF